MASSCFSALNGSLAATATATATTTGPSRPDARLCRVILSQAPRPLRPLELRTLSLTFSRKGLHRYGFSGVAQARAELSTDEVEALNAQSDEGSGDEGEQNIRNLEEGKLYVGNLPWSCTSEELAECFQKVGSVEVVEVIYDRMSGRSRGFGFVTMSSLEDANNAIQKLDGADYAGRTLRVNFPNSSRGDSPPPRIRSESNNANKLFVGNLAWSVDDSMLDQLFSEHGKVLEARVVNDRDTGRSRGFGFVTMGSEGECNEALNKMDGAFVEGRNLRVNMAADRPAARTDFY